MGNESHDNAVDVRHDSGVFFDLLRKVGNPYLVDMPYTDAGAGWLGVSSRDTESQLK